MFSKEKTLIFLHIHKTAGTSLSHLLMRQYPRDAVYQMDQHYLRLQQALDDLAALDLEARRRIGCLIGHVPYGVHAMLPQECAYVTMLREPVSRTVSQYYFLRAVPESPIGDFLDQKATLTPFETQFREHLRPEDTPWNSLEAFVDMSSASESLNLQTRMIGGFVPRDDFLPPYAPLPSDALDVAKENLRHNISVCGLVERFDESVLLMQHVFGWKNAYFTRENVGRRHSLHSGIGENMLRRIRQLCELDIELYAYAQELLTERLQELPDLTEKALRRFRLRNKVYQRLRGVYDGSGAARIKTYMRPFLGR